MKSDVSTKSTEVSKVKREFEAASSKTADLEEKLKNLKKDFDCQKHNSEAAKTLLEKKLKDQDKELKKEISEAQSEANGFQTKLMKAEEGLKLAEEASKNLINKMEAEKR